MRITYNFISFFLITGMFLCFCNGMRLKKYTPKEFLNYAIAPRDIYIKDSTEIIKQLTLFLLKREDFFSNSAYFDSTQLMIDTILYSPDFNKLATFIIIKNPTNRQLVPNMKYTWYYDGTCYLGTKQHDTLVLGWLGPSFTNSFNKIELSAIIRDAYFTSYATRDTISAFSHKYNLNDMRFWSSIIWKQIEEKKASRKAFEEERIKHPENVYVPAH